MNRLRLGNYFDFFVNVNIISHKVYIGNECEPAARMNPQETLELAAFIHELREKYGLTIFLIEHHMDLVMRISDYIYVIDFGSKIAEGIPQEVQNNQHVIDAYLGVVEDE